MNNQYVNNKQGWIKIWTLKLICMLKGGKVEINVLFLIMD